MRFKQNDKIIDVKSVQDLLDVAAKNKAVNVYKALKNIFKYDTIFKHSIDSEDKTIYSDVLRKKYRAYNAYFKNSIRFDLFNTQHWDRFTRYSDYDYMEEFPITSKALDIYASEITAPDQLGNVLKINSKNERIVEILETLFNKILKIESNLWFWTRNMVKYGDFYLFLDITPSNGVMNVIPIHPKQIEIVYGDDSLLYNKAVNDDTEKYYDVKYRLIGDSQHEFIKKFLITRFKIHGNDKYFPYGSSSLDAARRPWRQCLHKNTNIWTLNGQKKICEIKPGDEIYTFNTTTNKLENTIVKNCLQTGIKPTFKIKTSKRDLIATDDHPILTFNNNKYEYKQVKDLKYHDLLVMPSSVDDRFTSIPTITIDKNNYSVKINDIGKNIYNNLEKKTILKRIRSLGYTTTQAKNILSFMCGSRRKITYETFTKLKKEFDYVDSDVDFYFYKSKKKSNNSFLNYDTFEININDDLVKFIGFMLGDGWLAKNKNGVSFALGVYEDLNQEYINLAKKFGFELKRITKITKINENKTWKSEAINICSRELCNFMTALGFITGCKDKVIPQWCFYLPKELKSSFMKGICDSDGSMCKTQFSLGMINENVVSGSHLLTQQLFKEYGFPCRLRIFKGKKIKLENGKIQTKQDGYGFVSNIFLNSPESIKNKYICNDNIFCEKVISVEKYEDSSEVWDIEVESNNHNFIADGFVVHNCLMMEDAMLTYRVARAPSRFVFYIDVGNAVQADIPQIMKQAYETMDLGKQADLDTANNPYLYKRLNPMSILDNFYMPTRGGVTGNKIEELKGGDNSYAIEDVKYIKEMLLSSLNIPNSYLNYENETPAKNLLQQEDVVFAKAVNRLQRSVIEALTHIAYVHLLIMKVSPNDLLNFTIELGTSSTLYEKQRLENQARHFELGSSMIETFGLDYVLDKVFEVSYKDKEAVYKSIIKHRKFMAKLDKISGVTEEGGGGVGGMGGLETTPGEISGEFEGGGEETEGEGGEEIEGIETTPKEAGFPEQLNSEKPKE